MHSSKVRAMPGSSARHFSLAPWVYLVTLSLRCEDTKDTCLLCPSVFPVSFTSPALRRLESTFFTVFGASLLASAISAGKAGPASSASFTPGTTGDGERIPWRVAFHFTTSLPLWGAGPPLVKLKLPISLKELMPHFPRFLPVP